MEKRREDRTRGNFGREWGPKVDFFLSGAAGVSADVGPSRAQKETVERQIRLFFAEHFRGWEKPRGGGSPHAPSWGAWGAPPPTLQFLGGRSKIKSNARENEKKRGK
jgi:hypothetical protein